MEKIYEPQDVKDMVPAGGVEPHIELLEGKLRLHFHADGVSFGMVHPEDPRFAAVVSYRAARNLMLQAAREKG